MGPLSRISARLVTRRVNALKQASIERWLFMRSWLRLLEGSARLAASGLLLFARSKRSNQEKERPGIRADRAAPDRYPAVLAAQRPANNSAIPGLRQFAFPRWPAPLLGATAGDPFQARATATAGRSAISRADCCFVFALALARRMRADRGPYAAAGRRRKGPQGGRHGCRPVRCQRRDALSANPGACPRSRRAGRPETAASGCPSLWLLSLGQARESNPRAARRAEPSNQRIQ